MQEVLEYLQMKNHYYEKFYSLTHKFMEQVEKNNWEDIQFFVDNRERLLNIIRSFDHKIASVFDKSKLSDEEMTKLKPQVKELLEKRTAIANRIVALDLQLISRIDEHKSETIRELKRTMETKDQLDSFVPRPRKVSKGKDV
jgi:hypothetical protein